MKYLLIKKLLIMKKMFFLISFFSFLLSCKNDVEITPLNLIDLPEKHDVFRIDEEGTFLNAFVLDSFLIINTHKNDDKIHIYNKKNLQLIAKFGTEGLAPFELPDIVPLTNASITQKSNSILFNDRKVRQFKTINLNKFLSEGNVANCITSSQLDRNEMILLSGTLTILDDHKFVKLNRSENQGKGMFMIYDTLKKEAKYIEYVPKIKGVEDRYKYLLYYGSLNANSSKNSIVFGSIYFDYILFYDIKGILQKSYYFSKLKMPDLSSQFSGPVNESTRYTLNTYASSEYCFFYRACQSTIEDGYYNLQKPTQLLVFSWDGLLVNAFNLPIRSGKFRYCYDDEFGSLYLFEQSEEEKDPHIIVHKYKINDYLKIN